MTLRRRIRLVLFGGAALLAFALATDHRADRIERQATNRVEEHLRRVAETDNAWVHLARAVGAFPLAQSGDETEAADLIQSVAALESWRDTAAVLEDERESRLAVARFLQVVGGVPQQGERLDKEVRRAADEASRYLRRDRSALLAQTSDLERQRDEARGAGLILRLVCDLVLVTLLAALGFTLTKSVLDPLRTLRARMAHAEAGIEEAPMVVRGGDEVGLILGSFNRLLDSWRSRGRDLERRARRIEGLASIIESAGWGKGANAFVREALPQIVRLVDAEFGLIRLLNPETQKLKLAATENLDSVLDVLEDEIDTGRYIAGAAFQTDEPIIVDDALMDPRMAPQEAVRRAHIVSELSVPIVSRGRCTGALVVGNFSSHHYSTEEVTLLQTAGRILGSAVENGRLLAEAASRTRDLTMLLDLARAAEGEPDVEGLGQSALDILSRTIDADAGAFLVLRPGVDACEVRAAVGCRKVDLPVRSCPTGDGPIAEAIRTRSALAIAPGDGQDGAGSFPRELGFHSGLVVPVVDEGETVAVLALGSTRPSQPIDSSLLPLAVSATNQIGYALARALRNEKRSIGRASPTERRDEVETVGMKRAA